MTQVPRVLFTFTQAARALGVRREDVETWVGDGRLVQVEVDGRKRISKLELDRVQRDGIPAQTPKRLTRRASKKKPQPADPGGDIRGLEI